MKSRGAQVAVMNSVQLHRSTAVRKILPDDHQNSVNPSAPNVLQRLTPLILDSNEFKVIAGKAIVTTEITDEPNPASAKSLRGDSCAKPVDRPVFISQVKM